MSSESIKLEIHRDFNDPEEENTSNRSFGFLKFDEKQI